MKLSFAATSLLFIAGGANAFAPRSNPTTNKLSSNTALFETAAETPVKEESPAAAATSELEEEDTPFFEKMVDGIKFRYGIFQDAQAEGYDMKQSAACALAGTYDEAAIKEEINDIISSNSCVMFSWEASPSCKKAIEAFEKVGAHVKIVRLDDPWEDGNPIRAEIGKMTGKSSVPMIFMGGKYVGGYDAGVSDDAPGILDMAFKGTLRPKLMEVGALKE